MPAQKKRPEDEHLTRLNYIAIDFETANYDKSSACQIGMVRFIDGRETDGIASLIRPDTKFFVPAFTNDIHHISYNDVRDKPQFPEVWETLVLPFINKTPGIPFVAHNAGFDMAVIRGCCEHYGMPVPPFRYFCSLKLARSLLPDLESHRLTALGEHFGISYRAHDALEDSRTCGEIVHIFAEMHNTTGTRKLLKKAGVRYSLLKPAQNGR